MGLNSDFKERIQEMTSSFMDYYSSAIGNPESQFQVGDKVEVIKEGRTKGLQGIITRIIGEQYQIDGSKVFIANALKKINETMNFDKENKENENMSDVKRPVTIGVLDMWYQRKSEEIKKEADTEIEELISSDPVKCAFDNKRNELDEWARENLGNKYLEIYAVRAMINPSFSKTMGEVLKGAWNNGYLSESTKMLIKSAEQKRQSNNSALLEKKSEIETMLYGCGRVDDEWEVLIGYGIVNDNMTLNMDGNKKQCCDGKI